MNTSSQANPKPLGEIPAGISTFKEKSILDVSVHCGLHQYTSQVCLEVTVSSLALCTSELSLNPVAFLTHPRLFLIKCASLDALCHPLSLHTCSMSCSFLSWQVRKPFSHISFFLLYFIWFLKRLNFLPHISDVHWKYLLQTTHKRK